MDKKNENNKISKIILLGTGLTLDASSFLWSLPVWMLDLLHSTLSAGFAGKAISAVQLLMG